MSRIGEKAINIKEGVTLSREGKGLIVAGPLGRVEIIISPQVELEITNNDLKVKRLVEEKKTEAIQGAIARRILGAIEGVTKGFGKILEVVGTGFRAQIEGENLILYLGFSHPVKFAFPSDIKIQVEDNNKIKIFGADKEKVGRIAAEIKKIKKPDAYKGKGIRYLGEKLKLKPGKAAVKSGTAGISK